MPLYEKDFEHICDLGAGSGGDVKKARHIPTNSVMALKVRQKEKKNKNNYFIYFFKKTYSINLQVISITAKPEEKKQIQRELSFLYNCHSDNIVSFYGGL